MHTSICDRAGRRPIVFAFLLVAAWIVSLARGQSTTPGESPQAGRSGADTKQPARRTPEDVYSGIIEMNEAVKGLGPWKDQYADIVRSMNNLWRQNGWDNEADRYALDLVLDVGKIPPWEFSHRMEVLTGRMRERYGLSESEAIAMRGKMVSEIGGMLFRHAGVIFKQVGQYVEVRAKKEPMTPELIAEWTNGSDAVWADAMQMVERLTGEIRETLGPEHREVIDRDLASFHRRVQYWGAKRKVWAKGGWKAEDWGMQDDPIQMGLHRDPSRAALGPAKIRSSSTKQTDGSSGPNAAKTAGKWLAHDPNTWMFYVNHVAERYALDEAQRNTCRTVHKDKFDRAAAYAKSHEAELTAIPVGERAEHEDFDPIRSVFAELQSQLESIPTPKQKREVEP